MSLPPLIPLDEARNRLFKQLPRLASIETLALNEASGRILAADIYALVDVPPKANSSMDGYAVRVSECYEGVQLPVSQRIPAGTVAQRLVEQSVARIFTGAEIPSGADAVIMQESIQTLDDGRISVLSVPKSGDNIRAQGEDLTKGVKILNQGTRLSPAALGVIASTGIPSVQVYKSLRVALLCTGDELIEPGLPLNEGQIYNSNKPMLCAFLKQAGFDVVDLGQVADTRQATSAALKHAVAEADAVITTGGVSVGEEDHVKHVIQELGSLDLWRIKIRPGKPFALGQIDNTPVIGLPGNPMSGLVTFLLLARPCLMHLQGALYRPALSIPVPIGFSQAEQNRDEFVRVALVDGVAQRLASQSSGVLSSALSADGLLHLPSDRDIIAGEHLNFFPFCALLSG